MNRKVRFSRWLFLLALMVSVALQAVVGAQDAAPSASKDEWTINVHAESAVSIAEGMSLALYQVGTVENATGTPQYYDLDHKELKNFGSTQTEIENAIKALKRGNQIATATIGSNGIATFTGVKTGIYVIEKVTDAKYEKVQMSVAFFSLPYASSGADITEKDNVLEINGKFEKFEAKVNIEVIKTFADKDGKAALPTEAKTFYIGLFDKATPMAGAKEVVEVTIGTDGKMTPEKVEFKDLPVSTYLIYETDKDGNPVVNANTTLPITTYDGKTPVKMAGDAEGTYYPFIEGGNEVTFTPPFEKDVKIVKSVTLENRYDGPTEKAGYIIIKKLVTDKDDKTVSVEDTFYANVYKVVDGKETLLNLKKDEQGKDIANTVDPIVLKNEDTVRFSFPIGKDEDVTKMSFIVRECDKDGKDYEAGKTPLAYSVSYSKNNTFVDEKGNEVTLVENATTGAYEAEVFIKNKQHTVTVSKTDLTGVTEIEGAHIQILTLGSDGKVVNKADGTPDIFKEWDSTKTAQSVTGLVDGTIYVLRETVAPVGFLPITVDIYFRLDATGKAVRVDDKGNPVTAAETD